MTSAGRRYQRLRSRGQCTRCRRPVAPVRGVVRAFCPECVVRDRADSNAAHTAMRQRRQAREVCRDCEGAVTINPATGYGYALCVDCRRAQAATKQRRRDAIAAALFVMQVA